MGQLRTARSAVWLYPDDDEATAPVLVRTHGFPRPLLDAIGSACGPAFAARFRDDGFPTLAWSLQSSLGMAEFELLRHAGIAIVAPLHARDERLGWLALGPRVDGSAYGPGDLQVLEAALGIVSMSLQNARLYNRAREMNRQLRASNEHLSEVDRLKDEFLSNVNHELRTPLAVVMGSLDCVLGTGSVEPGLERLLEAALQQAKKLNGLIENLLGFSDAANARLIVRLVPEDVEAAVRGCVEERSPGVAAGLRELRMECAPGLPRVRVDRHRLNQILNELIDNAVKFTPRGSCVRVTVERKQREDRDWVRIAVSDDGPGIPADRLETLFHSFEQVDGSATREIGGLGMGLAFARSLAHAMQGRLLASSTLGSGSTFELLLPLA